MGINNLTLRRIEHRIGNVAGPPLRQGRERHHRRRGSNVALASANQAFVAQLMKPETRIRVDVAAIKTAEAVDGDRIRAVFVEYGLLAQIHGGRGFERFTRHALNGRGALLPTIGNGSRFVPVRIGPGLVDLGEGHPGDRNPHELPAVPRFLVLYGEDP